MRVYTAGVEDRKTHMAPAAEMPTSTTKTASKNKVQATGRLPSIEMEPKTLTLDQIKYAREAALYVVSTKTEEEAIQIFMAGLKPVQLNKNVRKSGSSMDSSDDDVDLDGSYDDGSNTGGSKGRRRGRRAPSIDIRDVATAPF